MQSSSASTDCVVLRERGSVSAQEGGRGWAGQRRSERAEFQGRGQILGAVFHREETEQKMWERREEKEKKEKNRERNPRRGVTLPNHPGGGQPRSHSWRSP